MITFQHVARSTTFQHVAPVADDHSSDHRRRRIFSKTHGTFITADMFGDRGDERQASTPDFGSERQASTPDFGSWFFDLWGSSSSGRGAARRPYPYLGRGYSPSSSSTSSSRRGSLGAPSSNLHDSDLYDPPRLGLREDGALEVRGSPPLRDGVRVVENHTGRSRTAGVHRDGGGWSTQDEHPGRARVVFPRPSTTFSDAGVVFPRGGFENDAFPFATADAVRLEDSVDGVDGGAPRRRLEDSAVIIVIVVLLGVLVLGGIGAVLFLSFAQDGSRAAAARVGWVEIVVVLPAWSATSRNFRDGTRPEDTHERYVHACLEQRQTQTRSIRSEVEQEQTNLCGTENENGLNAEGRRGKNFIRFIIRKS